MHDYSIVSGQIKCTVRALNPIKHRPYFMGIGNNRITFFKQQSRSFGTGSSGDCKSLTV